MPYKFRKHYTRDEAREMLPLLRDWLKQIGQVREELEKLDRRLESLAASGEDRGGDTVNGTIRSLARLKSVLQEFEKREIFIKDVDRGLIDFPAIIGGREVFLCWEQDEEDVEYWHDIDSGFAGREKLSE